MGFRGPILGIMGLRVPSMGFRVPIWGFEQEAQGPSHPLVEMPRSRTCGRYISFPDPL